MMMADKSTRGGGPRLWIRCEANGTWTAFRGAIPLASNLSSVKEAWQVIDRAYDHADARASNPQSVRAQIRRPHRTIKPRVGL